MKRLLLFALIFCALPLFAGSKEFHAVLHEVEHDCGIHHTRMPFVNMAITMAKPLSEGALKDFHMAVFESEKRHPHCPADMLDRITQRLGPGWEPFVRVHSNIDHEDTVMYMEMTEKDPRMIIATVEPEDTAVIQVRLSPESWQHWADEGDLRTHTHRKKKDVEEVKLQQRPTQNGAMQMGLADQK